MLTLCSQRSSVFTNTLQSRFAHHCHRLSPVQGQLSVLDLSESSPLLTALCHPDLRPLRTTFEGDFGLPLGDLYCLPNCKSSDIGQDGPHSGRAHAVAVTEPCNDEQRHQVTGSLLDEGPAATHGSNGTDVPRAGQIEASSISSCCQSGTQDYQAKGQEQGSVDMPRASVVLEGQPDLGRRIGSASWDNGQGTTRVQGRITGDRALREWSWDAQTGTLHFDGGHDGKLLLAFPRHI